MQPFLQLVAHDLYTKIGNDLSRTVLVFPNKRANLFFNEYLAEESDQPIWSPAAMSISDPVSYTHLDVYKRQALKLLRVALKDYLPLFLLCFGPDFMKKFY